MDPSHDASKVKAEGPGLNRTGRCLGRGWAGPEWGLGVRQALTTSRLGPPGVEVGKPTHFTVLTKGAGKAKLDVHFAGAAKGEAVRDFEIIDNHDYSYTVKYTAVQQVCPTHSLPHLPWRTGSCTFFLQSPRATSECRPLSRHPSSLAMPPEPEVCLGHGHIARLCSDLCLYPTGQHGSDSDLWWGPCP